MDKLNMSLDQIIKLQKKEKQQMQAKLSRAKNANKGPKNVGQKKRTTNVTGKGFKQFRGRVAGKKLGTTAKNNRVSPLNRQRQGQQQKVKQMPRKGLRNQNQQLKARQAVNQAKKKLQQKYTQQNQRNQRSQAFNQRRGLPKTQNAGVKQRLGVRKGQGQQRGRFNTGSNLRMDMVNRQQQQTKKQVTPRRINRQNNQQRQSNQQRQITNQQVNPVRKRKWGKTQQNVSSNPILQVSVPNRPTKSVSIQLSPNRQQNPQQRRLTNKVFQVQVAQERQQRKEGKQQPKRLIDNMLAQSQRQQQNLQNQVNQLQAVIANIQNTSHVKQNININRTDFSKRNTGLSLNQRFSSSTPQPAMTQQIVPQTTFSRGGGRRGRGGGRRGGGRGRGNRVPLQQRTTRQQLQSGGQRTVFL